VVYLILILGHHTSDISDDEDFSLNATGNDTILRSPIPPEERVIREQPSGNNAIDSFKKSCINSYVI
jgi:hypothetical protein